MSTSGTGRLERPQLKRRFAAGSPRFLAAVAPAGYAKSDIVRAYARVQGSSAYCECRGVRSFIELTQRIAAALVRGDAREEAALSEQRIANAVAAPEWAAFVERLWREQRAHAVFIFENLESALDLPQAADLLERLCESAPPHLCVAISSRRTLPFSLSRFAAPHETLTLRERDLAFTRGEVRTLLAEIADETLDRVVELTRGWPVAVLLFARIAREGRLTQALERAADVEYSDLYDYLAEHVLTLLEAQQFRRLLAIAAIPDSTAEEIELVLGDPDAGEALVAIAPSSPFVYRRIDGVFEAHPLVQTMLHERYPKRCREMLLSAATRITPLDRLRAAQLFASAGEDDAAAALLEGEHVLFADEVRPRFAEIVGRLPARALLRYPGIWASAFVIRSSSISQRQWLYEALAVAERIDDSTPLATRVGVLTSLANILTNLGRHEEALAALERMTSSGEPLPARYAAVRMLISAAIATRCGHFERALATWNEAQRSFDRVSFTRAIGLEEIVARVQRWTTSRDDERATLDRAIALARESGAAVVRVLALQEALFAAWFAGEDTLLERYGRELDEAITPNTAAATEVFRAALRGDDAPLEREERFERLRLRCYAALICCGFAPEGRRAHLARLAFDAARSAADAACIATAAIACAACEPQRRDHWIAQAMEAARSTDSSLLVDAVETFAREDIEGGEFAPMARRLRAQGRPAEIVLSVFHGTVIRDSEVPLTKRERELLFFLALGRRAYTPDEILEALWPSRASRLSSVVRVYVTRVRARLREPDVIVLHASGHYQIGAGVRLDVTEMESRLERCRLAGALDDAQRAWFESALPTIDDVVPGRVSSWEWFAPHARRTEEVLRQALLLLAQDAVRSSAVVRARAYAERLIALDESDRAGWELLIRASLAVGDEAAAHRDYKRFRAAAPEHDAHASLHEFVAHL